MKSIKLYCPRCHKQTVHMIWTEDGYGIKGVSRIFSSILSLGMSNLVYFTYRKCLSCGRKREIQ